MRMMWLATLVAVTTVGCKKSEEPAAAKAPRKLDAGVEVDGRGRMKVDLTFFDDKHRPMAVAGSYTATLAHASGTPICSTTQPVTAADFSPKQAFKAKFLDAGCPVDPATELLLVTVSVELAPAHGGARLESVHKTATKTVFRELAGTPPSVGGGSATPPATTSGSASGSAPAEATGIAGSAAAAGSPAVKQP